MNPGIAERCPPSRLGTARTAISATITIAQITAPGPAPSAGSYRIGDLPGSIAAFLTIDPHTGEWIWHGRLDRDGYGRIGGQAVHRVVYEMLVAPIPAGLEIDHVRLWGCVSRACFSPWHLQPVTRRVNALRGDSFAAVNARKDWCTHGHPFDLFGTYYRPNGHRDCRVCIRERVKKYKERLRGSASVPRPQARTEMERAA